MKKATIAQIPCGGGEWHREIPSFPEGLFSHAAIGWSYRENCVQKQLIFI